MLLNKFCCVVRGAFVGLAVLLMASQSFAIEVLPFKFDNPGIGKDSASQQKAWDEIMKYKLWGTGLSNGDGVVFNGNNIYVTDSSGYVGSASGNFVMREQNHSIGGPLLFGGSFSGGNGHDSILIGPSHFGKDFEVSFNGRKSEFLAGTYCIEGKIVECVDGNDTYPCAEQGFIAGSATLSCEKAMPIEKKLDVPTIDSVALKDMLDTVIGDIYADNSVNNGADAYIDVPPGKGVYDVSVNSINLGNDKTLYIRMPKNGRLTRIFLKGAFSITNSSNIRVIQANDNSEWDEENRIWKTSDTCVVSNADYSGNVLFYTPESINWTAGKKHIQGTFISGGTITISQDAGFAGQLIAKAIYVLENFHAEDFRYVPFDPPVMDPTLFTTVEFMESNKDVVIPLKLNKKTEVQVTFDYCFEVTEEVPVSGMTSNQWADITDFNGLTPICGKGKKNITIPKGAQEPVNGIVINPKLDPYVELYGYSVKEKFRLVVSDLRGAVLKDEDGNYVHDGFFEMYVIDVNVVPITRDTIVNAYEDSPISFDTVSIVYESLTNVDMAGLIVESLPATGSLTYFGQKVVKGQSIPVDSLGKLVFTSVKDSAGHGDDYVYSSFEFSVYDKKGAISSNDKNQGFKTITINVNPVNDAPVVQPATYTITGHIIKGNESTKFTGSIPVTDIDDSHFTYEFDPSDKNFAVVDSLFEIDSKTGAIRVKNGIVLRRTMTESKYVIGVKVSDMSASTGREEDILSAISKVTLNITYDIIPPLVDIVKGENPQGEWLNPTVINTNNPSMILSCTFDGGKEVNECLDTTLVEGCHEYIVNYENPDRDGVARDSVKICLSTKAPEVSISLKGDSKNNGDVLTIIQKGTGYGTDVFVNSVDKELEVTVRDSVTGVFRKDTVAVHLSVPAVPSKTLDVLNGVVGNIAIDENNPSAKVTPTNEGAQVVYEVEGSKGVKLNVSYFRDEKGDVKKTIVVNEKGKEESRELITVSYETQINGETVTVSYLADANTGLPAYRTSDGKISFNEKDAEKAGVYSVSQTQKSDAFASVSYSIDAKGNMVKNSEGDVGYTLTYTYVNQPYGNIATQSMFVILDVKKPGVVILTPSAGSIVKSNSTDVEWYICQDGADAEKALKARNSGDYSFADILKKNCDKQDTLTLQALEKGYNSIGRFFVDKAGNESSDTVLVYMKDAKDVVLAVEQPVTVVNKDLVEKYYAKNPPKKDQTFAVSIRNPVNGSERETLIGGGFGSKEGSGKEPYGGIDKQNGATHLGPTLSLDIKLPVINGVSGLATMDDIMYDDDNVLLSQVKAEGAKVMSKQKFVDSLCVDGFKLNSDLSKINLYNSKLSVKIWIYTSLGNFVNYYHFDQELNDPDFTDPTGSLQLFFEQKPDKDGYVRTESGKMLATGAYVYKVEASIKNELLCTLPPLYDKDGKPKDSSSIKQKGDVIKTKDDLLKSFGYKRPKD